MALLITITDAGRAEIINADNTGTGPVVITEIGFGTGQYAPSETQTALTNEVKRLDSIAGQAVAADTIHVIAKDEGPDAYNVGEFGLYSASGTLVAVYSQVAASGWIIQKAGASTLLLAVDIILESLAATSLTFGDVTFINPPATTSTPGVVQLEDSLTSSSASKALTAKQGKVLQDGKQPLDATLTALAALATAADKLIYSTGSDTFATTPLSAFIRTLLDDANATAALATLGAAPLNSPALTGTPSAPTAAQATNNTQLATTAFVKAALAALVDSSPGALNTLNELAAALGDDPNFATTMTNALAGKQPLDATLTALAALATSANKLIYSTGSDQFATTTLTAKARTLLASVDEAAMRTFLGLVKQVTPTDTSDGAMMAVAAFGLGGFSAGSFSIAATMDTVSGIPTGFYSTVPGATVFSSPPDGLDAAGAVINHVRVNAGVSAQAFQIWSHTSSARTFVRRGTSNAWSAWQELWHSGNLAKQASPADTSTGALMAVGAFGLGGNSLNASDYGDNLDNAVAGGWYSANNATLNAPTNSWYKVFVVGAVNEPAQIALGTATNSMYFRKKQTGAWSAWAKVWDSTDLIKQSSPTDATAGALMAVGAFGLGNDGTAELVTLDSAKTSGVFRYDGSDPSAPVSAQFGSLLVRVAGALAIHQNARPNSTTQRSFERFWNGTTWTPWVETWHSGNLTPADLSPPGAVVHFARNSAPSGWLKANGAAVSRTTYAALYAAIGTTFGTGNGSSTFNLPDLRGEFLRVWDDGRGVDSGRAFGSAQADELKSHSHTLATESGGSTTAAWEMTNSATGNDTLDGATTNATGGSETRPRNIALLACIKY